MFYGFFRWFNLNRDSLQRGLLRDFKCVIKETYTLLKHNTKDEKIERHIRLDQAGLLHNSNTPEAHITFIDNILKVRINFSTTVLETAVFASIRDQARAVKELAKKNKMIAKVQREAGILKSLISLYQQAKAEKIAGLNRLQHNLEDASQQLVSTDLTLRQKETLLEEYKSLSTTFKAEEDALNDIRDEFEQSNSSQLIANVFNKLAEMIKGEKTASQQQPELIEPERVDLDIVEALESPASQNLEQDQKNSRLVSTVLQEITIDNFDEALRQQTNPPEDMSALEFLDLLSRIREFSQSFEPLANSGSRSSALEQSHLYYLPTEAIKNELKSMLDAKSQADVDASFLQLKYWQSAPHFKKVVQDFCSSHKLESDDALMISPLQHFAMKNEVEIFRFLLLSGVSASSWGFYLHSDYAIDLQHSLLLETSVSEEIYMVFLEFFEGALSRPSQESLQQSLTLARLNQKLRGSNVEVKFLENTSTLDHPLTIAVQRDFYTAIPVILSKTASLVNIFMGFARFVENARVSMANISYMGENIFFLEDAIVQRSFPDFISCLSHMEERSSKLLEGKKGALNFIMFPKIMFRFYNMQLKSRSVISQFCNYFSKVKDLTNDCFASEVSDLMHASSLKSNKYEALMMAKASLYLCLTRLQQADLSVPLSFYKQLSALLIDCLEQLKSALTNITPESKVNKNVKKTSLKFFDDYLTSLRRFASDNKVNLSCEVIAPLTDFKVDVKSKNKPKKRRGRRR